MDRTFPMDRAFPPSPILGEIDRVQNPAFGAVLLWRYGCAYQEALTASPSHLLLYFLVLPISLHRPTLDCVSSTLESSGLGKFCEKLGKKREELLAIHERCLKLRHLTLSSIAFGIRANLFAVDYESGALHALHAAPPKLPERINAHVKGARKIGIWFGALEPVEIFRSLKVEP